MEVVTSPANRDESELSHPRIRVDDDTPSAFQLAAKPMREFDPKTNRPRSRVLRIEVHNARIGREEFRRLSISHEHNTRIREALLHCVENDAGDLDIGPERHPRENINGF